MANVSWTHNGSGIWTTKTDWSNGTLPGSGDQVSISTAAAATITVSSGTNEVDTLSTAANDALALTGGTLDILGSGALYGAVTQSKAASKFIVSGTGTYAYGNFKQTAGTAVLQGLNT
jgi:hypothetical protein